MYAHIPEQANNENVMKHMEMVLEKLELAGAFQPGSSRVIGNTIEAVPLEER